MSLSNYPPGVTGNEPQITGEWPCDICDGRGYDEDEDGKHPCELCNGTGILPEDIFELNDLRKNIEAFFKNNDLGEVDISPDSDGYLTVNTNLLIIGSYVKKED